MSGCISDIVDEYPSAEVIGIDISAVQPTFVPPNCIFQVDNAQLDWTFEPNDFDFIHLRYLYGAIDDWGKLFRQAYTHVRPGGWAESLEIDIETRSENPEVQSDKNHVFRKWYQLFFECGRKTGRTFEIARDGRQEQYMRKAGFTDLVSKSWKVPIGGWPQDNKLKQVGFYNGAFIDQSIDGFAIFPIGEILGWSFDEVTVLVSEMKKAFREPRSMPYFVVYVFVTCISILANWCVGIWFMVENLRWRTHNNLVYVVEPNILYLFPISISLPGGIYFTYLAVNGS